MAGDRERGPLHDKLKTIIEPVILTDITEENLPVMVDDDDIVPYIQLEIKNRGSHSCGF